MYFENRIHAGDELAKALTRYREDPKGILLALPRGGVPVAHEMARRLKLPLDVLLVRKLGVPGREEFAMGAIAEGDILYINRETVDMLDIPEEAIERTINQETVELNRRRQLYRHDRPAPDLEGRNVILVDDGLATGSTMRAAVNTLKARAVNCLIIAVPVGAKETCEELEADVDELVCLHTPDPFYGVGRWYQDFSPISDQEVEALLQRAHSKEAASPGKPAGENGTARS